MSVVLNLHLALLRKVQSFTEKKIKQRSLKFVYVLHEFIFKNMLSTHKTMAYVIAKVVKTYQKQ